MKKSLGAIALVSLLAMFSPAGPAPAAAAEVRIGVLMDFSGPLASLSPAIEAGALLAVEHANAAGGLFGGKVVTVRRCGRAALKANTVHLSKAASNFSVPCEPGACGAFLPSALLRTGRDTGGMAAFLRNELVLSLSKGEASVSPVLSEAEGKEHGTR